LFFPDGLFIEGWITFEDSLHVVMMEHGWLASSTTIIDPTIVLATNPTQTIHYYPGVARTWQELDALNNEMFPHVRFSNYGDDGMGHPNYRAAMEAAIQKAQDLLALAGSSKQLVEVRASDITQQRETDLPMLHQEPGMLMIRCNEHGTSEASWLTGDQPTS
jgi:hypothetical protein